MWPVLGEVEAGEDLELPTLHIDGEDVDALYVGRVGPKDRIETPQPDADLPGVEVSVEAGVGVFEGQGGEALVGDLAVGVLRPMRIDDKEIDVVLVAVPASILEDLVAKLAVHGAEDGVRFDRDHAPPKGTIEGTDGKEIGSRG